MVDAPLVAACVVELVVAPAVVVVVAAAVVATVVAEGRTVMEPVIDEWNSH